MSDSMSDEPPAEVLASLPRRRPHRRSPKRPATPRSGAPPNAGTGPPEPERVRAERVRAERVRAEPQREPAIAGRRRSRPSGPEVLGTAVQATAELAEIGLSVSARALRGALSRLPRA